MVVVRNVVRSEFCGPQEESDTIFCAVLFFVIGVAGFLGTAGGLVALDLADPQVASLHGS